MSENKYLFPVQTHLGYLNLEEYGELFIDSILENPQATDQDEIPGAVGRFGLDPGNPIPIHGVPNSKYYLRKLRQPNGSPIRFRREGSTSDESIVLPIDQYLIFDLDDQELARIYISPYHMKSSMTQGDTQSNDYQPCEIPSDQKKTNYKQMKCSEKAPEGFLTEEEYFQKWLHEDDSDDDQFRNWQFKEK